ncbi:D-alanyl-D-alanine carboxypeptidase family protein [Oceanirhabdus sp. W0125-5]|uniref:D-alanyl-D-alanine carboxypeptidase family protein n=1 Tax=Oceanirhabdus sp. W0125-5 TaxID=2999116 RepID=UPI0022F2BFD4|nr:D-alanyl-D-alanine carboxypeptidase family protein [Oceanirhabdus sp. W0125-5]WBW95184.1 D-alanyl-D-alanine carboxypeptidase family protein [Oceanirhabdus sp. W0125-5]
MKKKNLGKKLLSTTVIALLISSLTYVYKVDAFDKYYNKPEKIEGNKDIIWDSIKDNKDDEKKDTDDDSSDNINNEVDEKDQGEKEEQEVYIVESGDTLYKISVKFNMSLNTLKEINNLKENMIYSGQALFVINNGNNSNDKVVISNPDDILALVNKSNKLPSDYIPNNLVVPNVPFPFKSYHSKKLMRKDAAQALEELFEQAKKENIKLYALSGYRSYERQASIFASNVKKKGLEKANQFSARPGESEHQTGLAMDITSPSVKNVLTQRFGQTPEGKWVKANAHKFGFIIRYPQGKEHITGYQYEPWHLRYVGKEAAEEIKNNNFTLEEYLDVI